MSFENRDYNRGGGGMPRLSPQSVVMALIVANFIVFVLDGVLGGAQRGSSLAPFGWGHFSAERAVGGFQVWRFFTYQFVHADFMHFFFNMLGLYFFGPLLERWWGPRRFLAFYLLCGSAGAAVAAMLGAALPGLGVFPPGAQLVGASGALFGILAACAVLFPHQRVQLLFPPVPMTMRTMAMVFLGIAVLSVVVGSRNAGGEAAHLGGAALGFLLAAKPGLLAWADGVSPDTFKVKVVTQKGGQKKEKAAKREVATEAEIDRILAKVSEQGLQSLTAKEKKTLNRETERKQG